MVLSIIFLEDKHKILLHLSIFYEYRQFFQHRICFSIQPPDNSDLWPRLARSSSFFLIMLFKNHNLHLVVKWSIPNNFTFSITVTRFSFWTGTKHNTSTPFYIRLETSTKTGWLYTTICCIVPIRVVVI